MRFYKYVNEKRFSFRKPDFKTLKKRLKMFKKKRPSRVKKTRNAFEVGGKYKNKLKNLLFKTLKENYNISEAIDEIERKRALAAYLEVDIEDISDELYNNVFDAPDGEYLVLDDNEADEAAKEYIEESIWAFNTWFLKDHIDIEDVNNYFGFEDSYYDEDEEEEIEIDDPEEVFFLGTGMSFDDWIDQQQSKCEGGNADLYSAVQTSSGIDNFVDNAISADGRGHFLSPYDGEEGEQGNFFIYRVN